MELKSGHLEPPCGGHRSPMSWSRARSPSRPPVRRRNIVRARCGSTGRITQFSIELMDGRIFGATRDRIPSLGPATHRQLGNLVVVLDGAFLALEELDLHIGVDALVTRLMEEFTVIRRVAARQAGRGTSAAKAAASAENGRLGRPRRKQVALEIGQGDAAEPPGQSSGPASGIAKEGGIDRFNKPGLHGSKTQRRSNIAARPGGISLCERI